MKPKSEKTTTTKVFKNISRFNKQKILYFFLYITDTLLLVQRIPDYAEEETEWFEAQIENLDPQNSSDSFLWRVSALRDQSFTSLMADLRQDINKVSSFSLCLNGTFP